jgi:hypothetical protein
MLAGIVLQASATPKPSHRTATRYSAIHHSQLTRFQLSTVQWHHSLHHFRRCLVCTGEIFGLWAAAHPCNTIPLNSRHTVMVLAGQFVSTAELTIVSLDIWRVSQTTFFNARWSLSVIKNGLPGCGCAFTFPLHIMSPTTDLGNLRSCNVLTDFLPMWQPITTPHSK